MPSQKPTATQLDYLRYFLEREQLSEGWTQNPLAAWRAIHPEGTDLSERALLWRVKKAFTEMKSQGWVTETHLEHHFQDDEVNARRFEETLYRITERGKRAVIEAGAAPVITRRVAPATTDEENPVFLDPNAPETVYFADGPADGRVVTLPAGRHDQVLFAVGGKDVRYRRSRRPDVEGHAVFVPVEGAAALADA